MFPEVSFLNRRVPAGAEN